jgi:hypothetical protein
VRRARDAAHLLAFGVHLHRHRQERPGQRPQGTRGRRHEPTTRTATLRVGQVAIAFAPRVVPTLPVTPAFALTRLRGGRLWRLRMVGVGRRPTVRAFDVGCVTLRMVGVAPTLVLLVVMERLATF